MLHARHATATDQCPPVRREDGFMSILPACIGVDGQPIARKSRLREFTLSLGAFNLRMQALRQL